MHELCTAPERRGESFSSASRDIQSYMHSTSTTSSTTEDCSSCRVCILMTAQASDDKRFQGCKLAAANPYNPVGGRRRRPANSSEPHRPLSRAAQGHMEQRLGKLGVCGCPARRAHVNAKRPYSTSTMSTCPVRVTLARPPSPFPLTLFGLRDLRMQDHQRSYSQQPPERAPQLVAIPGEEHWASDMAAPLTTGRAIPSYSVLILC